jgi:hypothetical protein
MAMPIRPIFAVAIALALIPVRASAACPTNTAWGYPPVGDSHGITSSSPTWSDHVQCGSFTLDLLAGTVQLIGAGGGGEYSCASSLQASDVYTMVGPASAVPIPFEVRVHLIGSLTAGLQSYPFIGTTCNTSRVQFTVSSDAATATFADASSYSPCLGKSLVGDLAVPLAKLPGEPFPVVYDLRTGTSGGVGTIGGAITFANLPDGYRIVSCQGYGSAPVPTLPTSWGKLKQAYR